MQETDLPRRLARGDPKALAELYDRYAPGVFSLALRRLEDAGAAEEVVQDVFFKIWYSRAVFDATRGDLAAWIFAIARNTVYDRLRRRLRQRRLSEAQAAMLDLFATTGFEALEQLMAQEHIAELLASLTPEQRDLVRLVCVDGRTVAEAASLLSTPLGTAKSRLRAALGRLRQTLATEVRAQ